MIADSNSSALERLIETWVAALSATEFKVAAYLYYRLAQAGSAGLRLRTEDLAAATGVSVRTVESARQSLAGKQIIEMKSAPGETSHYGFPGGGKKEWPDGPSESDQTQIVESIESHPIDSANHPNSVEALVEKLTGAKPDSSHLHELQVAAGGEQKLEECLQWMAKRSKYSFDPEMPDLLTAEVSHLCRGRDSEFLRSQRTSASPLRR
jgi:hypothetical protein